MSPMNPRLLRPRASGGFSPKNISGLAAWYDMSNTADSNKVTASGGAISAVIDQSGNGKNATQATANNQPSAQTAAYNGLDAARFSNASPNDFLIASGINFGRTGNGFTLLLAIAHRDSGGGHCFVADAAPTTGVSCPGFGINAGIYIFLNVGIGSSQLSPALTRTANAMQVLAITGAGISGTTFQAATFRRNKGTTATTGTNTSQRTDTDRIVIGAGSNATAGADLPWIGDIGELLVYNRQLATAEIETVESYLAKKWGVTLT